MEFGVFQGRATVRRFADIGLDQLVMVPLTNIPHQKTLDSIAYAGKHMLPAFRDPPEAALPRVGVE